MSCPISVQMITKIKEERYWGHSLTACNDALNATLPRSVFFQLSQNWVCIWSVFEKIIGSYEVCISVNIGPFEETGALTSPCTPFWPRWGSPSRKLGSRCLDLQVQFQSSRNHPFSLKESWIYCSCCFLWNYIYLCFYVIHLFIKVVFTDFYNKLGLSCAKLGL